MPYAEFHCVHLLYSSVQLEKIWGEAGTKGVGSRGSIRYVYAMYSTKVTLWLRREQCYLPRLLKVDFHCPSMYSIEFFGCKECIRLIIDIVDSVRG